ncbi:diguanylate cyclase (GGDEF) domain-containing protein [Cognatiyoonia koreensis]|uniref:diguanylate cyclase n=1 Tax=Cognatiyoonia koreensis TaxID=364200 RepID=A0A1I0PIR7_9RHOB|nr:GGDEF domain-containing protein [Cognatiyoonia koreensis]SEW13655.1 diguanylate cyclase (GGDEF) domain-containing protein [Cognatiyoonia koreensis]
MERFVGLVAPMGRMDFALKMIVIMLICGALNYLRDILAHPVTHDDYWNNLFEATFVALPMATLGLMLLSHMKQLQTQLYREATTDSLTQLPNRRWFLDRVGALPVGQHVFVMLDIDHFKRINDTHGHDRGDTCLQLFARHMSAHLNVGDFCARFGGEEFAVLLKDTELAEAEIIAKALTQGIFLQIDQSTCERVTASAGLVIIQTDCRFDEALKRADHALYLAKANGRARFEHLRAGAYEEACRQAPRLERRKAVSA